MKKCLALTLVLIFTFSCLFSCAKENREDKADDRKVLLVSIDGMRPDAVENTEFGKYLMRKSAYSLDTKTVYPSVTLPCHMSMHHGVDPRTHGVTTNSYTPNENLGYGIAETLAAEGKTTAFFYNWKPLGDIMTEGSTVHSEYIGGEVHGWEAANEMIAEACINYLDSETPDFTFLYLGFLDEWGHAYGWLSEEYYYALDKSFEVVKKVMDTLSDDYTVIITSDHGGHERGHGTELAEDMTIPVFIIGDGFRQGKRFEDTSILDITPTVLDLLGVVIPEYWQGKALR